MANCQVCEFDNGRRRKCAICGSYACRFCRKEIADDFDNSAIYCEECAAAWDAGYDAGYGAGSWMDLPEIGSKLSPCEDWVGYGVVTRENLGDVFSMLAAGAEENARQFSPWEFTAKEINDREYELDLMGGELWELYDQGVSRGIETAWNERKPDDEPKTERIEVYAYVQIKIGEVGAGYDLDPEAWGKDGLDLEARLAASGIDRSAVVYAITATGYDADDYETEYHGITGDLEHLGHVIEVLTNE